LALGAPPPEDALPVLILILDVNPLEFIIIAHLALGTRHFVEKSCNKGMTKSDEWN
jgi:hypothetical protein